MRGEQPNAREREALTSSRKHKHQNQKSPFAVQMPFSRSQNLRTVEAS